MKTFSVLTKEELCKTEILNTEETLAEYAGMVLFGSSTVSGKLKFSTENKDIIQRYKELCAKLNLSVGEIVLSDNGVRYSVVVNEKSLYDYRIEDAQTGLERYGIPPLVFENEPCRRAFVKGAFLGGGTIIDPNKNYNLEIVVSYMGLYKDFSELLSKAGFDFKSVIRKSKYILYLKKSEAILDFLTYICAYKAQMELINIKIEKELRNEFNRSANSETANLEKTISASVRQIQAIEVIADKVGIDELPDDLRELALLRMKYKSESLGKLGLMLDPPLGKSGVNHRFNRILAMAERLSDTQA